MRRFSVIVFVVLASLVVAGCTTQRHLNRGDEALEDGNMRRAVHHYESALSRRHALEDDEDFVAKLSFAQSRVAYDDAVVLDNQGLYELAIDDLLVALAKDPSYAKAEIFLGEVRGRAARWRYGQALLAADAALLDVARDHLERAMVHDADMEEAHWAMLSLSPQALPVDTLGLTDYREGVSLSSQRRWAKAQDAYRAAIALNTNLLPARSELFVAQETQAEALALASGGDARIRERRMGPAISLFEQSLEVWPFNEHAQERLTYSRAELAKADAQFALATASAQALKWDDAIAQADAGLEIDRSHQPLRALRPQLPQRAAADYTGRGESDLAAGQLDNARNHYRTALRFVAGHDPARRGMANVFAAWGGQFEQAGRPGAALLHYREACDFLASDDIKASAARMTRALYAELEMSLAIDVAPGGGDVTSQRMEGALLGQAQRDAPRGLTVAPQVPSYVMEVSIQRSDVTHRRRSTSSLSHLYQTSERRHNPEYDRVADRLSDARRDLSREEAHYHRHRPNDVEHDDHHHPQGSHQRRVDRRIESYRSRVYHLEHQLSCTPHYISVRVNHTYRYQLEHHEATGELTLSTRLIDTTTGQAVDQFASHAEASYRDDYLVNPRPDLGLRADALDLPSRSRIAWELAGDASQHAVRFAIDAAVNHKLDTLRAQAAVHREAGEAEATLELEVAGGLLIGMVDSSASQNVLDRLSESNLR